MGECVSVASPLQRPLITSLRKNLGGRLTAPALNDFSLVCDWQEGYVSVMVLVFCILIYVIYEAKP